MNKPSTPGFRSAADLSEDELRKVVSDVQGLLYYDCDRKGDFWNPEKAWNSETFSEIAEVLSEHGLVPKRRARV